MSETNNFDLTTKPFYNVVPTQQISTISSSETTKQTSDIFIIFIIVFILAIILGVFYYLKNRRRKKKQAKEKSELGISTLGSLYEVHSLLSLNKDDHGKDKYSLQEETSTRYSIKVEKREQSLKNSSDKLSKVILIEDYQQSCKDVNQNITEDLVDCGRLQNNDSKSVNFSQPIHHEVAPVPSTQLVPPLSEPELIPPLYFSSSDSSPEQVRREINPERQLLVKKNHLFVKKKECGLDRADSFRPYSQIILSNHMKDKQKQEDKQETSSQNNILIQDNLLNSTTKSFAKSESHLAHLGHLPPVPPKLVPILPSKQKINKSREDMKKLDKEMLRTSMTILSDRIEKIDEDYDFPAAGSGVGAGSGGAAGGAGNTEDDHELMDYDEPSVSYSQYSLNVTR